MANDRLRHSIIQAKMASSSVERTGYPNRIWMGFEGVRGLFKISGTYGPSHISCSIVEICPQGQVIGKPVRAGPTLNDADQLVCHVVT